MGKSKYLFNLPFTLQQFNIFVGSKHIDNVVRENLFLPYHIYILVYNCILCLFALVFVAQ